MGNIDREKLAILINDTNKLTDEEKILVRFVIDRQFIANECVVTNKDIQYEILWDAKKFNKILKSLNEFEFFIGERQYNTHSGKFNENRPNQSMQNYGGVKKRLKLNEVSLIKFLTND